jgi:hypothetical protein
MTGVCFAGTHTDLDRRLQSLKSSFVQSAQQVPVRSNKDRILLGFTEKTTISLQSISLSLNGQKLLQHAYQENENISLREGGIQPLLDLKLPLGKSQILVSYTGKTPDGKAFEQTSKVSISKSNVRKIIELTLSNKANSAPRLGKQEH